MKTIVTSTKSANVPEKTRRTTKPAAGNLLRRGHGREAEGARPSGVEELIVMQLPQA